MVVVLTKRSPWLRRALPMPLNYSVFISYPHTQSHLLQAFIERFERELQDRVGLFVDFPLWYDKERLKPGFKYDNEIGTVLCESICLIALYMPVYEKHPYCLREFLAMER